MAERRKFKRLGGDFRVQIDLLESETDANPVPESGKIGNISAAGILLRHSKPLEIGRIVDLTFLSPNSFEIFKVSARVVRVDINRDESCEIGVEYINLLPEDERRLDYFLSYGSHKR